MDEQLMQQSEFSEHTSQGTNIKIVTASESEPLFVVTEAVDIVVEEGYQEKLSSFSQSPVNFTLYKTRWAIVLSFCLFNTNQCISWLCVSVLSPYIQIGYNCSLLEVNLAISLQQFILIPGFVLSAWMYNYYGLRELQLVSALMTFIGGWLRMMALTDQNFWWVVAGNTFVGSAACFQMGGLNIIAVDWCGDKERGIATSLMTMSNPLGMLIGYVF